MKLTDYETIMNFIRHHSSNCSRKILSDVILKFGDRFAYHTLMSVFLTEVQNNVKKTFHAKCNERKAIEYYQIYEKRIETSAVDKETKISNEKSKKFLQESKDTSGGPQQAENAIGGKPTDIKAVLDGLTFPVTPILITMANEVGLPPFLMARIIVEQTLIRENWNIKNCEKGRYCKLNPNTKQNLAENNVTEMSDDSKEDGNGGASTTEPTVNENLRKQVLGEEGAEENKKSNLSSGLNINQMEDRAHFGEVHAEEPRNIFDKKDDSDMRKESNLNHNATNSKGGNSHKEIAASVAELKITQNCPEVESRQAKSHRVSAIAPSKTDSFSKSNPSLLESCKEVIEPTGQSRAVKDQALVEDKKLPGFPEIQQDRQQHSVKSKLSSVMKNPELIPDSFLREQVRQCISHDVCYGPINDAIRHSVGLEYEEKLVTHLLHHNIPFLTEDDLRKRGYDKTPDTKLEVPIAVNGHPVCWIESKASFGDLDTHRGYLRDQYYSYWNRFGPGLVIYWFGFIDCIKEKMLREGMLVMDNFPTSSEITFMDSG